SPRRASPFGRSHFRTPRRWIPVENTPVRRIPARPPRWDAAVAMQRTQEAQMASKRTEELDFRSNDGLEVTLLWQPETNQLTVSVYDSKAGDDFDIEVDPAEATDAFHHPYAYAASRGVHFVAGTRTSEIEIEAVPA